MHLTLTDFLFEVKEKEQIEKNIIPNLVFRHQSSTYHKILKPVSYEKIEKERKNPEYVEDRKETEETYRGMIPDLDPNKSFLYATIVGYHQMESPKTYPGYTFYFKLTNEQIEKTIFDVVGNRDLEDSPMLGKEGLIIAIEKWNRLKKEGTLKSYEDKIVRGIIYPRIEVIISYPIEWFKYIPQIEDR